MIRSFWSRRWNCPLFAFLARRFSINLAAEPVGHGSGDVDGGVGMVRLVGYNSGREFFSLNSMDRIEDADVWVERLLGAPGPGSEDSDSEDGDEGEGHTHGQGQDIESSPSPPNSKLNSFTTPSQTTTLFPDPSVTTDCIASGCVACQAEQAGNTEQDHQRWKYHRSFINKEAGYGLVAREFIPTNSIIYADQLVHLTEREEGKASTGDGDVEALLGAKVTAMGSDWKTAYLSMPKPNDQKQLEAYTSIWTHYHLPVAWNGVSGGVLGLNLSFTNHSCLPNASLTLVNKYRSNSGRRYKKPRLAGAVVRSFMDIHKGQEITISYFYAKGEVEYRRLHALDLLGFRCSCRSCLYPKAEVEDALGTYYRLDHILNNPRLVTDQPALAYQAACRITDKLTGCGIADTRLALIWSKCALIAAYHSDIARIRCFLLMILKLTEVLQGPAGHLFHRAIKWFECMSAMPGFGISMRGLSVMKQADVFLEHRNEAQPYLFMVGAEKEEYVRVGRYLRVPDEEMEEHGHRFEVVPDTVPIPASKKRRRKKKNAKAKKSEKCIDPEKDFLSLWLGVVNGFVDQYAVKQELTATKKDKSLMSSPEGNQQCTDETCSGCGGSEQLLQVVIQDVGARKKMVWKRMGMGEVEEVMKESFS